MKQLSEREIQDLLAKQDFPAPPADLAARIKHEIPDQILVDSEALDSDASDAANRFPMSRSRVWLMAASVALAVGGGFIVFRNLDQMPSPGEAEATAETSAPRQGAGAPVAEVKKSGPPPDAVRGESSRSIEQPEPQRLAEAAQRGRVAPPPETEQDPASSTIAGEGATERPIRSRADKDSREAQPPADSKNRFVGGVQAPIEAEAQAGAELQDLIFADPEPKQIAAKRKAPASTASPAPPPAPQSARRVVPPPAPPSRRIPPPTSAAPRREPHRGLQEGYDDSNTNAQIAYGNEKIAAMQDEARRLEEQLKALESGSAAAPSTGGTTEPNDAPYGDVFFHDTGTNPFIDTEDDALSTFGLDVDTGSYTVARKYLRDGNLPPHSAVRVEEFINYFDYGDAAPEEEDFAIYAEGAPAVYGEGERYYLLRFNLSGREVAEEDRRPALLTFVVDVSGSMGQGNRLGLVKRALGLLLDQLRSDDRIALVIYGSRGQVVLEPTGDKELIRRAIEQLRTGGSTNAVEGLTLAYDLAARHRRAGEINRVILCSDGVANVGDTSSESILDRIRRQADQGVELTTVGFGMGNYNDVLMERLADDGNGRYAYVDTLDEARRIFVEDLTGTLQTLAAEARVQVEFEPSIVERYRLLGYENRDVADERFRDDTVDAGEIGVGHRVTALYEVKLARKPPRLQKIATLRLRYGSVDRGQVVEQERAVTGRDFASSWQRASPALQLTSLVAEYAEILNRSYWARTGDLDDVFRRAQRVQVEFAGDHEVADFVGLVGQAARLWPKEKR